MIDPAPIIRLVPRRIENDCAVVALAAYLGLDYDRVLEAGRTVDPKSWTWGFSVREVCQIAKRLGKPLAIKRSYDLDADTGLLSLTCRRRATPGHFVLLVEGRIYDHEADHSIGMWLPDVYLAYERARPGVLLVSS